MKWMWGMPRQAPTVTSASTGSDAECLAPPPLPKMEPLPAIPLQQQIDAAYAKHRRKLGLIPETEEEIKAYWHFVCGYVAARKDDESLGYATRLAVELWKEHWSQESPEWKPLPDLLGVLTQIDNMTARLRRDV